MSTDNSFVKVYYDDVTELLMTCHAALAQDSPNTPEFYINQILGLVFGYADSKQKERIEVYLAEKEYLPPVDLILD